MLTSKTADYFTTKCISVADLDTRVPAKITKSPFFDKLPLREQYIIKAHAVLNPKMKTLECKHEIGRTSAVSDDRASAVIPGSKMFLLNAPSHPRLLLGAEGLIVHGVGKASWE